MTPDQILNFINHHIEPDKHLTLFTEDLRKLVRELQARAERAEAERDELRAQFCVACGHHVSHHDAGRGCWFEEWSGGCACDGFRSQDSALTD